MADWGGSKTKGRSACNTSDLLGDEQACFDIDDSLNQREPRPQLPVDAAILDGP